MHSLSRDVANFDTSESLMIETINVDVPQHESLFTRRHRPVIGSAKISDVLRLYRMRQVYLLPFWVQ